MLSGFVLAYLYVDADGKQTISNREFFLSRWIRLYPLHFIMLPLLLPMVLMFMGFFPTTTLWGFSVPKPAFVGASGVMSLLLVQAWCPEAALSWNFATWALSAVAFFYVMFPSTVKFLSRQSRSTLWTLFWLMPVLNLIPSIIFLWKTDGNSATNYFWSEVVMRTPLFWLPHFVMAIILCRLYKITRHDMTWCQGVDQRSGPSWGDLAIVVVLVICMTPDSFFQTVFCLGSKPPNFILRHGTLAPIYAVVLYNLALGRGWFARFLSLPTFEKLGEASFGIFIFQGPMIMPSLILFAIVRPLLEMTLKLFTSNESFISDTLELFRIGMTVAIVVGLSIVSLRYFERPVARWLKKRLGLGAAA